MPGHSGFASYVQRVMPGIPGIRLQLNAQGKGCLIPFDQWTRQAPPLAPGLPMRMLQRNAMVQHGIRLNHLLRQSGLKPELIYSPFFDALLGFPQIPQLITCHDLTPLIYPNSCKAWLKYRLWQPRHLVCAAQVVAISQHVADQLIAFGLDGDRVVVVPNGITVARPPVPAPASEDLLVIARHDANKNLCGLLVALAGVQERLPRWHGVVRIVGRGITASSELLALRRSLPRPEKLVFIDQLSAKNLLAMLRGSLALVSASLEEGFDYPVLEAKAEGIPTLLSDIRVHREFHQESSLFFPVDDDGRTLAEHLYLLMYDSLAWRQLSDLGQSLARSLSVERQQEQISDLINELV